MKIFIFYRNVSEKQTSSQYTNLVTHHNILCFFCLLWRLLSFWWKCFWKMDFEPIEQSCEPPHYFVLLLSFMVIHSYLFMEMFLKNGLQADNNLLSHPTILWIYFCKTHLVPIEQSCKPPHYFMLLLSFMEIFLKNGLRTNRTILRATTPFYVTSFLLWRYLSFMEPPHYFVLWARGNYIFETSNNF